MKVFGFVALSLMTTWSYAMNADQIRCVIETHPSWPSVDAETLKTWGDTPGISYRSPNAGVRSLWDVLVANYGEWEALTEARRDTIKTNLFAGGNGTVDISDNGTPTSALLLDSYPSGTATRAALQATFVQTITPFEAGPEDAGFYPNYVEGRTVSVGAIQESINIGVCQ